MSSPAAASGREIVEAIDPRERFAKPAFPQEEQGRFRKCQPATFLLEFAVHTEKPE